LASPALSLAGLSDRDRGDPSGHADLAVIEGTLTEPNSTLDRESYDRPGGLGPIARALNMPTVAVLTCPDWDHLNLCQLPEDADAVLLDGLEDASEFPRIAAAVRMMTRKPVIGAVESLPEVRQALSQRTIAGPVDDDLIAALAQSFLKFADLPTLKSLAHSRPFPTGRCRNEPADRPRFRVAYAQDEAFGGYFPDTLEMLEALGADLVEFSPLGSEGLPEAVDLVMIGCGYADQYADRLAANFSLVNALRSHVYRGRRIYSEGGGTVYLGRSMSIEGREFPGVGILPFDAVLRPGPPSFESVTCTLRCETWLGPRGTVVRGYQTSRWDLQPTSELCHCEAGFGPLSDSGNFFYHHHAVGSLVHLHLAALPQVVAAFAGPHRPSLTLRQAGR
jgi:cobyrinic acid a,c-diamide synthase